MSVPVVPTWPQADPFPYMMPVIDDIQPFTYRQGASFLEILMKLQDWMNNTFVPEVNNALQTASTNYQNGITNSENAVTSLESSWTTQFNSYMTNVNASLQALNDAAVAGLANDATSQLGTALRNLFETVSDATTLHSAITAINNTLPTLETIANANAAHAALQAKWEPNLAVTAGTVLISPDGDAVTALFDHTTGATYNPNNWTGNFGYLMATFGNNVSPDLENLYVNYSPDGKYVVGGMNNPVYHAASTTVSGVRDPSILFYNGRWYCAYTINTGQNKTIEIAVSDDLVNWTLNCTVDLSSVVDTNAWAPEMDVDTDGSVVIHFTNVNQNVTPSTHRTFWIRSENPTLTAWTAPVQQQYQNLTAPRPIDPCAIEINGTWHIFYGNDGSIEHATAPTLTGTWTVVGTGNWAGWYTDTPANSTIHYEGPEIIQVGPSLWRIYMDQYTGTAPYTVVGYFYSETSDPTLATGWSTPKMATRSPGYADGCALRHGSWVKLPSSKLQEQVLAATAAGGPGRIIHGEYNGSGATAGANAVWTGNLVNDPGKTSAAASEFFSVSGTTITILQNGEYTCRVVAPNTEPVAALGGGYMAIKGVLPGTSNRKIHASVDIPTTAAAHSVEASKMWLIAGDQLLIQVAPANAMSGSFNFSVVMSCDKH